jgi:glutamate--cysteine ligase
MYFIIRDGVYHDMTHMTFRQFLDGKARNEVPDGLPPWATGRTISTLFPDVRLKRFLEMRGADGGPWRRICALPAFWVGLLYDEEALDAAETLTSSWTYDEVRAMRDAVPVEGISAVFRNRTLRELAREVLAISRGGLKRRNRLNRDGFDETHFLSTLDEVVARGTAPKMLNASHVGTARSSGVFGICVLKDRAANADSLHPLERPRACSPAICFSLSASCLSGASISPSSSSGCGRFPHWR